MSEANNLIRLHMVALMAVSLRSYPAKARAIWLTTKGRRGTLFGGLRFCAVAPTNQPRVGNSSGQ
jgi:hypothetical protein